MTLPIKCTLLLFSFYCFGPLYGQVFDDWEARPAVAVEHEFNNEIEVKGKFRHYLRTNSGYFERSSFGIKADYEYALTTWLAPGIDYYYKYNNEQSAHVIRYSLKANHRWEDSFEIVYSFRLQFSFVSASRPNYYLRNKVEGSYVLAKALSIFLFAENYQMIHAGLGFYAQKSGIGAEWELSDTHELELTFDLKNKSDHQDIARISLNYTYIIK